MLSAITISRKIFTRFAVLFVVAFSVSPSLYANTFPRGCEPIGFTYSGNYLVLNPAEAHQTFFMMQNKTNKTIRLERHETRDVFMSPKLEVNFGPDAWSAFASDEQNVNFQCFTKNEDRLDRISCSEVLDICQYPRVRFALSNMGNYWVSTNRTQNLVIKEAVAKGIYLKW